MPQWATVLPRSKHTPPQDVCPDGQTHALPLQIVPPLQAVPQAPQFWGSDASCTQAPPHEVSPAPHDVAQTPKSQTVPAEHAAPQAPQFSRLDLRLKHTPPQDVSPVPQTHAPALQMRPVGHATPQAPHERRPIQSNKPIHRSDGARKPSRSSTLSGWRRLALSFASAALAIAMTMHRKRPSTGAEERYYATLDKQTLPQTIGGLGNPDTLDKRNF